MSKPWETLLPIDFNFDTIEILKALSKAKGKLGELKGVENSLPDTDILLDILRLQETQKSSEIEGYQTTTEEMFTLDAPKIKMSINAKEVKNYREAIDYGYDQVKTKKMLTTNMLIEMMRKLKKNDSGLRNALGTNIKDSNGNIVYTPPQDPTTIKNMMNNLERFINNNGEWNIDPLIKMAIFHFQFESIHPFFDGNGRVGRMLNILYLILQGELHYPSLYLSRYIVTHKMDYYRLLQDVRDKNSWEEWIIFNLKGIEETATETIQLIKDINKSMEDCKDIIQKSSGRANTHELVSHIFKYTYVTIGKMMKDLNISRPTATKYLEQLTALKLLQKFKVGSLNFYLNNKLLSLF